MGAGGRHDRRSMLTLAEFEYAERDAVEEERRYEAEGLCSVGARPVQRVSF